MARVYSHFENNLQAILRAGERAGVKQIVCTVGSNLKDCAPFASSHSSELSTAKRQEWEKYFTNGATAETAQRFTEATNHYRQAALIDPAFAELHFCLARCLLRLGDAAGARRSFERARDLDTLRFRAHSRIREIIQRSAVSQNNRGIYFLDASELLATNSPNGISGDEFFYEHVHLTFEGNYLIARAVAVRVAQVLPPTISGASTNNAWLSAAECARRLGWNGWSQHRVLQDIHRRLLDPPFTNQFGHDERKVSLEKQLAALSNSRQPEGLREAAAQFREALAHSPDDWVLHEKLGEVLRDLHDARGAMEEWEHVRRLLPHYPGALNNLGNLFNALGQSEKARQHFYAALRLKPDLVEAFNGLGLAAANEQKLSEALEWYQRALRVRPNFVAAHVNMGVALASQGKNAEAMRHYEEALRWQPDHGITHMNLGKLLAAQGKLTEATKHFVEATRSMPDNAAAHYNLGNALVAQNQEQSALMEYSAAVRLEPGFADARVNLGIILVRQGQFADAIPHLSEAVRMNSNSAPAHLSLGVALRQQGRSAEASAHFRETLRIDPANAKAREWLGRDL